MALCLTFMLLAALLFRSLHSRWLAPGPLFAGYWLVASALPVLFFSGALVTTKALAYITVGVFVFGVGSFVATSAKDPREMPTRDVEKVRPVLHRGRFLRSAVIFGTLSGALSVVMALRAYGFSLSDLTTVGGLFDVGNNIAVARYEDRSGSPVVALLRALNYGACLAAPFLFVDKTQRRRGFVVAGPLVTALAYSTITTERLGILIAAVLFASGYIAMRLLRDGEVPSLTLRNMLGLALSGGAVALAFISIAFVRVGRIDSYVASTVAEKLSVYAFGYLPAFSQWLTRYINDPPAPGWGTSSFPGVEFLTGVAREATRAYDDRVKIDVWGTTTNIYTAFRNLLLDFSEIGALLVLLCAGFALGRAYRATKINGSAGGAAALASGYSVILLSNTMMITTFTNVVGAIVLGVWVVWLSFREQPDPVATLAARRVNANPFIR